MEVKCENETKEAAASISKSFQEMGFDSFQMGRPLSESVAILIELTVVSWEP